MAKRKVDPWEAAVEDLERELRKVIDNHPCMRKPWGERESYEIATAALDVIKCGMEMRLEEIAQEEEDGDLDE